MTYESTVKSLCLQSRPDQSLSLAACAGTTCFNICCGSAHERDGDEDDCPALGMAS